MIFGYTARKLPYRPSILEKTTDSTLTGQSLESKVRHRSCHVLSIGTRLAGKSEYHITVGFIHQKRRKAGSATRSFESCWDRTFTKFLVVRAGRGTFLRPEPPAWEAMFKTFIVRIMTEMLSFSNGLRTAGSLIRIAAHVPGAGLHDRGRLAPGKRIDPATVQFQIGLPPLPPSGSEEALSFKAAFIMAGEGMLFYLIGASGSGKDSVIRCARDRIGPDSPVVFAHRYITRPAESGNENHIAVSNSEFRRLLKLGCFAMHWDSHGLRYGIGIEIDQWLEMGLKVVVNGSREYLGEAAKKYRLMTPILIRAPGHVLRERLMNRGRESADAIEERLTRSNEVEELVRHPRLIELDNSGPLENACRQLLSVLA
jgi:ribose 1,5-bisphosphokinase